MEIFVMWFKQLQFDFDDIEKPIHLCDKFYDEFYETHQSGPLKIVHGLIDLFCGAGGLLARIADSFESIGLRIPSKTQVQTCAMAIMVGIASIPRLLGIQGAGRIRTVKTIMREFEAGLETVKRGFRQMGNKMIERNQAYFEEQRKRRRIMAEFIECYPTHGNMAYEQTALRMIYTAVYYHLGIDLMTLKIGFIQKIYDLSVSILDGVKEYPDQQFFRKHLSQEKRKAIKAAIDELKQYESQANQKEAAEIPNKSIQAA